MIDAFPLCWPEGRPRTGQYSRETARFNTSFAAAYEQGLAALGVGP